MRKNHFKKVDDGGWNFADIPTAIFLMIATPFLFLIAVGIIGILLIGLLGMIPLQLYVKLFKRS